MSGLVKLTNMHLLCDACGHRVPIPAHSAEDIGRPCPKCGENLLTREDYEATKQTLEVIEVVNTIFGGDTTSEVDDEYLESSLPRIYINPRAHATKIELQWPATQTDEE